MAIKKTVWRSFCSKVGLVKSSAMGASDLYSPGVKVMIKRKRHKFYGGLGTIMTKPLNKKAAFRVFMVDAATTIEIKLKDVEVPKGVLERMEREANYKQMLARRQNQDWFGLPIVRKVGALKKARYRMSKAMRHRSAKAAQHGSGAGGAQLYAGTRASEAVGDQPGRHGMAAPARRWSRNRPGWNPGSAAEPYGESTATWVHRKTY